jgi:RNA polymerase sigma-70 factor, ECF subfamily
VIFVTGPLICGHCHVRTMFSSIAADAGAAKADRAQKMSFARPSFEAVYDAHAEFLWRSARGFGVPETSVDDVLQDVFIVVHRRLPEFDGRASIRTWLVRILVRVISQHRRRFRRKEDNAELPTEVRDPKNASPMDEAARAQAARLLMQILDAMDEDQRTVFVLAEIEQMPVPEIAGAIDVKVNTVYSRLRLARREYDRQLARLRAKDAWREP